MPKAAAVAKKAPAKKAPAPTSPAPSSAPTTANPQPAAPAKKAAPKKAQGKASPAKAAGGGLPALSVPGWADTGSQVILGALLWGLVVLPFLRGGPAEVKKMLLAKFFNKAPDGSYL